MEHDKGFTGTIGRTVAESTSSWANAAPPARPNVVVVLLDDVGYSQFGCYGSAIETPALDGLAAGGIRYSNFHVTPFCSPTRACLLTGRNHHAVGMGRVSNMFNGYPNTRGIVTRDAANLAEILRPHGYSNLAVGKWHLAASEFTSPAGPYDHWPLRRGFDRFYGFMDGETNQWSPELIVGNERVDPPGDDYHLSEGLVDTANLWLRQHVSSAPEMPFFLYVSFGAAHSPHHAPRDFIEKYAGRFDHGWDVERDLTLRRQRESGLNEIEQLPPPNPNVQRWADLDADEQRMAARFQEVFAGFLDHTDVQIARLIAQLDAIGVLDNTIVLALSDNGASGEGGPHGTFDRERGRGGPQPSVAENLARYDDIGGPLTWNHYPFGWAMAGNTPYKRYKGNTHSGGVRAPFIVHWPAGMTPDARPRTQFCHAVDVVPTLLDVLGVDPPEVVGGFDQEPMHGESFAVTFTDADAPEPKDTQYFEALGHRAIWHDGWKAVTFHTFGADYDDDSWELYDLRADPNELHDLAGAEPERLRRLLDLWWGEAERYGVLPLDDFSRGLDPIPAPERVVLYDGAVLPCVPRGGLQVRGMSHRMTVRFDRVNTTQGGVIVASGGRFGGWALFVHDNRLHYTTNDFGERGRVVSDRVLPTGPIVVRVDVVRTDTDAAYVRFFVNDEPAGAATLSPFRNRYFANEPTTVGRDTQTPVDDLYEVPNDFSGDLIDVTIDVFGGEHLDQRTLIEEIMRSQ